MRMASATSSPCRPTPTRARTTTGRPDIGLVRLNKKDRSIRMECWPRHVDVTDPNARQYRGWPVTVNQLDNYGKSAAAYLPTIQVRGAVDPVIQVVEEGGEVATPCASRAVFRPKVFTQGTYTVHVGEGPTRKTLRGIKSLPPEQQTITGGQGRVRAGRVQRSADCRRARIDPRTRVRRPPDRDGEPVRGRYCRSKYSSRPRGTEKDR